MNNGTFASKLQFTINETVKNEQTGKNEYKELAKVDMPFPTLADFGIDAEIAKDESGNAKYEDGVPCYSVEAYDWLQFAIVQQLKAQNRNKFVKGELKEGMKLPENFAELVAVGERSGEALKARHEARASLAAYLKSKGKSEAVAKLLSDLFTDANSIVTCQDKFATALAAHIQAWVPTLSETDKERYSKTIEKAVQAINNRDAALGDL